MRTNNQAMAGFKKEFAEHMQNTLVMNDEEYQSKYIPLIHFVKEHTPKQLFRYRSCTTYHIDGFWKNEAYHVSAICRAGNQFHSRLDYSENLSNLSFAGKISMFL